ncbi:hypothetical protein QTP70_014513, partial [Hemibagrus guttatus]
FLPPKEEECGPPKHTAQTAEISDREDEKPAIILDYKHNKECVPITRSTLPGCLTRNKRRVFPQQLRKLLETSQIQRREQLPHTAASAALVKAVQGDGSSSVLCEAAA